MAPQRPEESPDRRPQRYWYQPDQHFHDQFSLKAFNDAVVADSDMAAATTTGEADVGR
jgi:hypothetical protein